MPWKPSGKLLKEEKGQTGDKREDGGSGGIEEQTIMVCMYENVTGEYIWLIKKTKLERLIKREDRVVDRILICYPKHWVISSLKIYQVWSSKIVLIWELESTLHQLMWYHAWKKNLCVFMQRRMNQALPQMFSIRPLGKVGSDKI